MDKLGGIKDKLLGFIDMLKEDKKKLLIVVVIVVFLVVIIMGAVGSGGGGGGGNSGTIDPSAIVLPNQGTSTVGSGDAAAENSGDAELYNQQLVDKQSELIVRYGSLPDGYLWDYDGSLISLGNKNLTAEETMYAFLNGIRTLDFSTAQLYSRASSVVTRYDEFYTVSGSADDRYEENFFRNMYTEVLMSIQTHEVTNVATFADNKQVFTVELEILDLSDKDFWLKDRDEIFNNLYVYEQDEEDDSKSEQYVFDYILNHYKSDEAKKRVVTVNITLEKDATLDTGWLVTIDKDIDNYCYYTDGVSVNRYIVYEYRNVGRAEIREERLNQGSN